MSDDDDGVEKVERELNELHDEVAAEARQWRAMLMDLVIAFAWDLMVLRKREGMDRCARSDEVEVAGSDWTIWAQVALDASGTPDVILGARLADEGTVQVVTDRQNVVRAAKQSAAFQYNPAPEWMAILMGEDLDAIV